MDAYTSPPIGVILPKEGLNQVTWAILREALEIVQRAGLQTYLAYDQGVDDKLVQVLRESHVSLVVTVNRISDHLAQLMTEAGIHIEMLPFYPSEPTPSVLELQQGIIGLMMGQLLSRACQRIGFVEVNTPELKGLADIRYHFAKQICEQHGLKAPERIATDPNPSEQSTSELAEVLLRKRHLDGFVCFNDQVAMAVCNALRQLGRMVPQDAKVVGIDNSPQAAMCFPPLTTVAYNVRGIAANGTFELLQKLGVEKLNVADEVYRQAPKIELIVRQSA